MIRHAAWSCSSATCWATRSRSCRRCTGSGFAGHDVIVFHILDEAEALFPFEGMLELEDNETRETLGRRRRHQGRLPRGGREFPSCKVMHACPHRLRSVAHRNAVRQGPDVLPAEPAGPGVRAGWNVSMINAGLAAGAALAALPVILHLFMRQTPKHVIFPALRLVRERQKRSKKRMRIKNWLLLLARMAVLALMALALARPRLYSQMPLGDQSVPTALGLVFDTSLSMGYKENDKTRLDEAKERARGIARPDSRFQSGLPRQLGRARRAPTGCRRPRPASGSTAWPSIAVNRPLNVAMGQVYRQSSIATGPATRSTS